MRRLPLGMLASLARPNQFAQSISLFLSPSALRIKRFAAMSEELRSAETANDDPTAEPTAKASKFLSTAFYRERNWLHYRTSLVYSLLLPSIAEKSLIYLTLDCLVLN